MAKTISLKAGESRVIGKDTTDNPKLCEKRLSNGQTSLYLQYYLGYQKETNPETGKVSIKADRKKVSLNLYLYSDPRTPDEREHNKNTIELAKRIRYEKQQERLQAGAGYRVHKERHTNFLNFFKGYCDNYTKKDKSILNVAYSRFVDFLNSSPKYSTYSNGIQPCQITKELVQAYADYLRTRSHGTGAATIFSYFKKVVIYATEQDVFTSNPCTGVSIKTDKSLTKEILSMEEITRLANTPFPSIRTDVKRAFLFCLYTGIRFCDVNNLTFGNVDYSRQILTFTQQKTEGHSAHSQVIIPLNSTTLALIGERGGKDEKIFKLMAFCTCLAIIRKWAKAAGIDKHLTWHCARHSFAVNVLSNGADIKTVSSLLGHSSIAMTTKYLHEIPELKRRAVDSLPALNL